MIMRLSILVFTLLFFYGCSEESATPEETAPSNQRTTNVSTYTLVPDSLIQYSRLSATVNAWRDITISALESGVVQNIHKEIGAPVKRGDLLAQLNLELLEAAAIEANANLKFQAYNYKHSQKLFSQGSISEQTHRATEYDFNRAKSTSQTINNRLAYGRIRAPFAGQIATRFITKGQLVPQGGPTFRLVQTDSLRVTAWVAENEIVDFTQGSPVSLRIDALPNQHFEGQIAYVGPATDGNRRVFPIEVHLTNTENKIRPGMIGTLQAVRKTYRNVIVIPREAVLERETGPVAFVAKGNTAHLRPLVLGPFESDKVIVHEGLSIGDQLIIKGGRDLIDGDPVNVTYAEPKP